MPYYFKSKEHWVKDVIKITESKNRRRSQYINDLTCLHCEGNFTSKFDDQLRNVKCIDGVM